MLKNSEKYNKRGLATAVELPTKRSVLLNNDANAFYGLKY
jgi:hypothetical protein